MLGVEYRGTHRVRKPVYQELAGARLSVEPPSPHRGPTRLPSPPNSVTRPRSPRRSPIRPPSPPRRSSDCIRRTCADTGTVDAATTSTRRSGKRHREHTSSSSGTSGDHQCCRHATGAARDSGARDRALIERLEAMERARIEREEARESARLERKEAREREATQRRQTRDQERIQRCIARDTVQNARDEAIVHSVTTWIWGLVQYLIPGVGGRSGSGGASGARAESGGGSDGARAGPQSDAPESSRGRGKV